MPVLLLGPIEATDLAASPLAISRRTERVALAVLTVHAGGLVTTDALAEAVWGDEPPDDAARLLRPPVSRLRTVLRRAASSGRLEAAGGGYSLHLATDDLDTASARHLHTTAAQASAAGRFDRAAALLRRAEGLWRGTPLADLAFEPFARVEVARLEELHSTIVEDRVEAELALGHHRALAAELPALVDAQPYREVRWAQLMRALYRSGRQAEALRTYERLRCFLGEEVGIEPLPWVRALEGAMLRHSPDLEWQAPGAGHRGTRHVARCRTADDRHPAHRRIGSAPLGSLFTTR